MNPQNEQKNRAKGPGRGLYSVGLVEKNICGGAILRRID